GGVHGGHQATLDAPLVVEHLGHRGQAVGGARRIGDDGLARILLVVDAEHEHRRVVLGRRRHDHLPRARVDVLLRRFLGQEQAGGLDHHVRADLAPLQVGRVALLGQADAVAVDDQEVAIDGHVGVEAAVHGVVAQHVGQVVRLEQVVDADDLDVLAEVEDGRAEHVAADAAEAIDAYLDRHAGGSRGNEARNIHAIRLFYPVLPPAFILPMRPNPASNPLVSLLFGLVLLAAGPAHAWSVLGHALTGELAQRHLDPVAAAEVERLLAGEPVPTLAGVASWADHLRNNEPERFKATSKWHYVNYPRDRCEYEASRDCKGGDCVIGAIQAQQAILADRGQSLELRRDALKFLVHFVGDVHQPMHAGNRGDLGGNRFQVSLRTELEPEAYARKHYVDGVMGTNLHSVWDYYILGTEGLELQPY